MTIFSTVTPWPECTVLSDKLKVAMSTDKACDGVTVVAVFKRSPLTRKVAAPLLNILRDKLNL